MKAVGFVKFCVYVVFLYILYIYLFVAHWGHHLFIFASDICFMFNTRVPDLSDIILLYRNTSVVLEYLMFFFIIEVLLVWKADSSHFLNVF